MSPHPARRAAALIGSGLRRAAVGATAIFVVVGLPLLSALAWLQGSIAQRLLAGP